MSTNGFGGTEIVCILVRQLITIAAMADVRLKPYTSAAWRGKLLNLQPWRMCLIFSITNQSDPHTVNRKASSFFDKYRRKKEFFRGKLVSIPRAVLSMNPWISRPFLQTDHLPSSFLRSQDRCIMMDIWFQWINQWFQLIVRKKKNDALHRDMAESAENGTSKNDGECPKCGQLGHICASLGDQCLPMKQGVTLSDMKHPILLLPPSTSNVKMITIHRSTTTNRRWEEDINSGIRVEGMIRAMKAYGSNASFEVEIIGDKCNITHIFDPKKSKKNERSRSEQMEDGLNHEDQIEVNGKMVSLKVHTIEEFILFMELMNTNKVAYKHKELFIRKFDDTLKWFHKTKAGKDLEGKLPPKISNLEICLFDFYKLVIYYGGYGKVSQIGKWKEIARYSGFPSCYDEDLKKIFEDYLLHPQTYYEFVIGDKKPNKYTKGLGTFLDQADRLADRFDGDQRNDMVMVGEAPGTTSGVRISHGDYVMKVLSYGGHGRDHGWQLHRSWLLTREDVIFRLRILSEDRLRTVKKARLRSLDKARL
ncbi:ARID DNA-binding domain-containing protein [Tanacetum coccineum]